MIQDSFLELYANSMFVHNMYPKLKFIALDYMTLQFIEIMHRLVQKEKYLVDMGELKYHNNFKEPKRGGFHSKEDKNVYAIKESQSKEKQKFKLRKFFQRNIRLHLAIAYLFKYCLQKGLIAPNPQRE